MQILDVPTTPVTPDQPVVPEVPVTPAAPTPEREAPATPAEPQHVPTLFQKPGVCFSGMPLARIARAPRSAQPSQARSPVAWYSRTNSRPVPAGPWHQPR